MPRNTTFRPSKEQLDEEHFLFVTLYLDHDIAASIAYPPDATDAKMPFTLYWEYMKQVFPFFKAYFTEQGMFLFKIDGDKIIQNRVTHTTAIPSNIDINTYEQVEEARENMLNRVLHPDYKKFRFDYTKLEQQKFHLVLFFVQYLQYWVLSEKIFVSEWRRPTEYAQEMQVLSPQERVRPLKEKYFNFLQLVAQTDPALFDKILQDVTIDELMSEVRRMEGVSARLPLPTAKPRREFVPLPMDKPSVKVWAAIDQTDRRVQAERGEPLLTPRRRELLQTYLTTDATMGELDRDRVITDDAVREQLLKGLRTVYPHLPPELRDEYNGENIKEGARALLRSRSGKGNIVQHFQRTEEGKRVFPPGRSTHISEGNARRSQAIREGTYTGNPVGRPRRAQDAQAQETSTPDQ